MSYTLPSDANVVGSAGHTTDHNNIVDVLSRLTGISPNGAVPQSQGSIWNAGVYDPRAFGAVGNGTTDDTTAINNAIAAMPASGGVLNLSGAPVSYLISSPIVVSGNQVIVGSHLNAVFSGGGIRSDVTCSASFSGLAAIGDAGALGTGTNPVSTNAISILGVSIDMTSAPAGTTDGILCMSFGAWIYFNEIKYAPANGIHITNTNAGGHAITNTIGEVRVCRNAIALSGNCGILVNGTSGNAPSDGYCIENIVRQSSINLTGGTFNSTGAGIDFEFSADWHISRNHVYANAQDGIIVKQSQTTFIDNNFIDHFGLAGAASTTYHGINVSGATGGPATHVNNNSVWNNESFGAASTVYQYYALSAASGATAYLNFSDNTANQQASGSGTQAARTYAGGGGTLNVYERGTLISPSTLSSVNTLSGTVNLVNPGATTLNSGGISVPLGVSSTYGTLTTVLSPPFNGAAFSFSGVSITWAGTFSSDSVNVQLTATFDDGSTATAVTASVTSASSQNFGPNALLPMFKNGRQMVKLQAQARTNQASTSVTCTVTGLGLGA